VVTVPADGSLIGPNPVFAFSGTEPDLAFRCSLDGTAEAGCAPGPTFAFSADGAHALSVRAVDRAGNASVPSIPVSFRVDATAPTLSIDSPAEGAPVPGPDPEIRFSTGEAQAAFACRIDDGPFTNCQSPFKPVGLVPGRHIVFVRATDAVGNVSPLLSRSFVLLAPAAAAPTTLGSALGPVPKGPPRPRVIALRIAGKDRLAHLRRKGLPVVAIVSADARFLRLRLLSAPSPRAGAKSRTHVVAALGRRLTRGGTIRLTLPAAGLRKLVAGRYTLEATAGLSARALGGAVAAPIRLTR